MHKMGACSLDCDGAILQMLWVDRGERQRRKRFGLPFLPRERSFGDTHLAGLGLQSVVSLMSIYNLMIGVFAA